MNRRLSARGASLSLRPGRTESCGLRLVPGDSATPEIRQQVVNALAALGAEPQHGTSAKPPVR